MIEIEILRNRQRNLGIIHDTMSELTGVCRTRLVSGLGGRVSLTRSELDRIEHTLSRLQQLQDEARPFPIDFTNVRRLKLLLEHSADGTIKLMMSSPLIQEIANEVESRLATSC